MKKFLIILAAITLYTTSLQAQVNKEVEVTKAYIPTVSRAEKPTLKAPIIDTAYINPDVDYSITPLSITTPLQTEPIKPATVTYWEFNKASSSQIKVGMGYPFNSLLQGYWASHNASVGYLAANIDHCGDYSSIESLSGDKVSATQVLNSVGVDAGLYVGDRTLAARVSYLNDSYTNYAYEQVVSPQINYQQVGAALNFGDDFVDLSRLNFSMAAELEHFYDNASNLSNNLEFEGLVGREISLGDLLFGVDYKYINSDYLYQNNSFAIAASLQSMIADWNLDLGVRYIYDKSVVDLDATAYNYIIPEVIMRRTSPSLISPFLAIGGSVEQNNYAALTEINPYIGSGISGASSIDYNLIGGIEGQTASSKLSYRLYAGYQIGINSKYWVYNIVEELSYTTTDVYQSYFNLNFGSLNTLSLNFDATYMPFNNLCLNFEGHVNSYYKSSSATNDYTVSQPKYTMVVDAHYTLRNFKLGIEGELIGERSCDVYTASTVSSSSYQGSIAELPTAFDLSTYAQWRATDMMAIFIEGSNLCGANIYPWPLYRGFGARVTAGVKIKFR
ncbi:MAG: hypothetical protein SNI45_00400 [Rikenellaceae bacterium]